MSSSHPRTVLIFGHSEDPHVIAVAEAIRQLSHRSFIFDRYHAQHVLALEFSEKGIKGHFRIANECVELQEVDAVWWRLKPTPLPVVHDYFELSKISFINAEWRSTLGALAYLLPQVRWVNKQENQVKFNYKPVQLSLAQQVGLKIPHTVFSNSPEAILGLFTLYERLIYKTICSPIVVNDHIIYTSEVKRTDIVASGANVGITPGIYQQLVDKVCELRVTVVGEQVFTAAVHAGKGTIDWRRVQFDDIFEVGELDRDTQERLLAFHKAAGLTCATYDFMVNEAGDTLFLECNPGGQWLWLEQKLQLPITRALAELLT